MASTGPRLTLKTRYLIWRARLSTPSLLARFDEKKAVSLAASVSGGLAIFTLSLLAWLTDLPFIFPALGPSTFILFTAPLSLSAAPRSVILGHWTCLAVGIIVWRLMCHLSGSPVSLQDPGWPLFCGPPLALAVCCLLLVRLSCPHPPACATALVVAMGGVTHWLDLLLMAVTIVALTYQTVFMNRFAGLPVPLWRPRPQSTP